MAITHGASGAAAVGTTSLSVPYPAGITAGQLLTLYIANKYPAAPPSTPDGWTLASNAQGTGGAGASGADSGQVLTTVFHKVAVGDESGSLAVTITGGNSSIGRMSRWTKTNTTWEVAATNGADNSAGTDVSVTGAADPGITAGDVVMGVFGGNSDVYSFSTPAMSATGISAWGTAIEIADDTTFQGDDCSIYMTYHPVTTGTATDVPTYTATASGTAGNAPSGSAVIFRIRETAGGGDVTPPTLGTLAVPSAGTTLTGTLSESGCIPTSGTGGFTLGGTSATVASWAISGTTLTLTLTGTVQAGETVTLSYDDATTTDDITDAATNKLADITNAAVTNNSTQDTIAPTLSGAATNTDGDEITATLSESGCVADGGGSSGTGGFTLSGTSATVSSWAISGTTLTLTLSGTVANGETVTYSYARASTTDDIRDAASNYLADFSGAAVTNNVPSGLTAGTASFVSSGPAGISVSATDATGGTAPYTYQWERNEDGGAFGDLAGETALTCDDATATTPGVLYGYRLKYTDDVAATVTSNTVTGEVYDGGPLTGGGSTIFATSVIRGA